MVVVDGFGSEPVAFLRSDDEDVVHEVLKQPGVGGGDGLDDGAGFPNEGGGGAVHAEEGGDVGSGGVIDGLREDEGAGEGGGLNHFMVKLAAELHAAVEHELDDA